MEKKNKNSFLTKEFPPLDIWLDDLEDIIEAIVGVGGTATLESDEFSFESVADLENAPGGMLDDLTIIGRNPYVSLALSKDRARLYCSDVSATARGVFEKMKDILNRRIAWGRRFLYSNVLWAVLLLFFSSASNILTARAPWYALLCLVLMFMVFAAPLFIHRVPGMERSRIVLARKREQRSFWRRNRDQVYLVSISAGIGAILGSVVTWLLAKI